ncbi:putative mitogen-activated protein kinase kinase kinase STE-STE11 family [Helianthus annuus]|uniref:mitogen-activated protein kinase kinase kinase n=1 Tax=Helianthus annuus TaxID=4232 RepID=A0A251SGB8_HELAN|nr:mitogen-activated protein kinase kinase kinase 3 [Helianthus annuus]KAF5768095.1 putative mitogen-activated protein kinase kinase kinase STE-STE11 family [Helianthus annuus]KAJ0463430.1 putative mitogen-activated protein kinase kinase kinase STE-STE11 family [Helianthus annuus]KAJ0467531.1 putative mitogen-activated protein kinase kinase kinase STE-STE11 family [Helianthus annuus]KAJ0484894.1 putative mitogen-activated protein kinase kinase kinase STE-STE11 family [Helianthus annuus]KAJ0655
MKSKFIEKNMSAWFGRKSNKDKDNHHRNQLQNHHQDNPFFSNNYHTSDRKHKSSFDGGSPRVSRDFSPSSSSSAVGTPVVGRGNCGSDFSGFDPDRIGHVLPQPSVTNTTSFPGVSPTTSFGVVDHHGSGSVSSSGGSSMSSGDELNLDHGQLGFFRRDTKLSPQPRSPGPGSRVGTAATSPLHQRLACTSLDSPNRKLDDGKNAAHPLPLPPGSPTSSSSPLNCCSPTSPSSVLMSCQPSKWKKGRLLGRGTFGHVYLGFNSENGQMCAIKEVKVVADDQSSKECLKQLNQEITLLSQLSHPNIVQYYGSELGEETLSVYLEYVSGGSIHKLLQEYGPFREPVIQNYTRQVLSGLAYLHGRNTVHRDIKGANILVDPNGEIKLADFGMAKHIKNCTSMLSFKGSPYWMAPEVVMNTNGYNLAVDIWSLGCTVLEMATSKPPWGQYEGVAAIFKIGNSKDMPEIPDHLSNDAKSFIKQCLQRDPSLRPSASKLLDHAFVRDQSTSRGANMHLTKEAFPFTFDGSRTPTASEMHSNRTNMHSFDVPVATASRGAMLSPRRNTRMITSLPVSPTSSPLRQYGSTYRSGYVSPPHPSFTMIGQSQGNFKFNDVLAVQSRHNGKMTLDPRYEVPQVKPQTPTRTPRSRII